MPTYRNGEVPANLLVTFASGWLPNEGTWYHQLPPATYAKHLALVALAKRNTGRILKISEGWGAYRPLHIQVYARNIHGVWAATPGTSSHGMFWERTQCAAIDYGNWSYVYNGNRAAFYRDVRAVGLEPGLISPQRGYPDEPWHVVDKSPWAGGSAAGGSSKPVPVSAPAKRVGKIVIYVGRDTDKLVVAIPEGGKVFNFTSPGQYNLNRETIAVLNGKLPAESRTVLPPDLKDVVFLSPEKLNLLIKTHGAYS